MAPLLVDDAGEPRVALVEQMPSAVIVGQSVRLVAPFAVGCAMIVGAIDVAGISCCGIVRQLGRVFRRVVADNSVLHAVVYLYIVYQSVESIEQIGSRLDVVGRLSYEELAVSHLESRRHHFCCHERAVVVERYQPVGARRGRAVYDAHQVAPLIARQGGVAYSLFLSVGCPALKSVVSAVGEEEGKACLGVVVEVSAQRCPVFAVHVYIHQRPHHGCYPEREGDVLIG